MRSAAGCPVKGGGVIWATDHWRTVLDLKGRLRCRVRGAKGAGVTYLQLGVPVASVAQALPGFTPLPTILAIIKLSTIEPLDLRLGPIGVARTSLLPAMADGTARAGVFRSTDRWRRTTVGSGLRYPGPLLSGSGVAMPTDPAPFRVGNPGRHGGCGFVRVRPQLRLVLPGRRIKRVRRHRVGTGSRAQCRALPCRRRGRRIGPPGFDFDAVVPSAGIDRHFFVRMGKQKEPEPTENDHGRCCDNAERDEVEQGAEVRLWCPDALIWKIGGHTRRFGRPWTRVSGCELLCQLVERLLSERSAGHLAIALSR
jgi:hypothetical protein